MTFSGYGRVIKGVGGLFTVRLWDAEAKKAYDPQGAPMPLDGATVQGRGRGILHRKGSLLAGDAVRVSYGEGSFTKSEEGISPAPDGSGIMIEEILPRTNALIRPPMANLSLLFITMAAASPTPILETVDKLISIAEFNGIEPVILITKRDLDRGEAERLASLYRHAGFAVFVTGEGDLEATEALLQYIRENTKGRIAAFSGASGVGKSTMLNRLFPELELETGEISRRIERGKNTTRSTELYPLSAESNCGYLADTPGFTMLDFERFDFFEKEDLPGTFREFTPYIGRCKFTKCSHTKEEGCAILDAVRRGDIEKSRHDSFVSLYNVLKKKTKWS